MKVLHQVGHLHKWNLDSFYKNDIGDGFVFCAYSFPNGFFSTTKICGYDTYDFLSRSFFDLQYFGSKEAGALDKGKLKTYSFHPAAHANDDEQTNILIENLIKEGIKYQIETLGLAHVIIPNYYENDNIDYATGMIVNINKWLQTNKKPGVKYFMTIPVTFQNLIDEAKIDKLLYYLTGREIVFEGYYIVAESKPEARQKLNNSFRYMTHLARIFKTLKKQSFETIYAYANWDALIYLSLTDIDYITIATYENLRNFSIRRFTENDDGGPSKGWYFSERLLNVVKAPLLDLVRINKGIELIRNDRNIFSDAILVDGYPWSNQKPEVHKNYLLSIERMLKELAGISDVRERTSLMIQKIDQAIETYTKLENLGIYLSDESKNYHLNAWRSFLLSQK